MKSSSGYIRLPEHAETIAPVTILDGQGHVVRVVRRRNPVDPSRRRAATGASGTADFRDRLLDLPGLRRP